MTQEIFLDTNILIDYLTNREPFSQPALRLFALAENSKVRLSISAISYTTIYYVLRKNNTHRAIIQSLTLLSKLCNVLPVNQAILDRAMTSDFTILKMQFSIIRLYKTKIAQ